MFLIFVVSLANILIGEASVASMFIGVSVGVLIYIYSTRSPQFMMILDIILGLSLCVLILVNTSIDNSVKSKSLSF